jgi:copper resistance protein C
VRREVTTHNLDRRELIVWAVTAAAVAPPRAYARMGVFLVRAEPGVGLTVTSSVRELRLFFDQAVLAASSSVQVTNSAGATIPTTRPTGDPSGEEILIVHFGRVLLPGVYRVSWHVVSVDQRPASGTYRFAIA